MDMTVIVVLFALTVISADYTILRTEFCESYPRAQRTRPFVVLALASVLSVILRRGAHHGVSFASFRNGRSCE